MSAHNHEFNHQIIIFNETENCGKTCSESSNSTSTCQRNNSCRRKCLQMRRVIYKSGLSQVHSSTSLRPLLGPIYIKDLANTLINCSWKWTLTILCFAFFSTWLTFACIWMIIARNNGDLDGNPETCLTGIKSFAGYLLFSIETQATIGYGNRSITHNCFEAIVVLCLQMLTSIAICSVVVSIFYEKISGPGKINSMNAFSKYATICQRDSELCLIFRVRDSDRRYQCNNDIKAYIVQKRGQEFFLKSLKLENIGILLWPMEVVHKIDKNSPLWNVSAKDLLIKGLEIIVRMEGLCLSTSNTSSIQTSYISKEILWGHSFQPCVKYDLEQNCYIVNHNLFNQTKPIPTPLCSAQRFQQVLNELFKFNIYNLNSNSSNSTRKTTSNDEDSGIASLTLSSPVTVHNPSTPPNGCNGNQFRINEILSDQDSSNSSNNEDNYNIEFHEAALLNASKDPKTSYNTKSNYFETSF